MSPGWRAERPSPWGLTGRGWPLSLRTGFAPNGTGSTSLSGIGIFSQLTSAEVSEVDSGYGGVVEFSFGVPSVGKLHPCSSPVLTPYVRMPGLAGGRSLNRDYGVM